VCSGVCAEYGDRGDGAGSGGGWGGLNDGVGVSEVTDKTLDEIAASQRADRRKIREDAELFETLVKSPGWKRYLELVEQVGQNFYVKLMTPLDNSFEVVKLEYAKGALNGLNAAASLPGAKIAEARELRREAGDEE
jgi:hypothetical protein